MGWLALQCGADDEGILSECAEKMARELAAHGWSGERG